MKKSLREAWARDLESGKFIQAVGALHKVEFENSDYGEPLSSKEKKLRDNRLGFCCLGVLSCRIANYEAVKVTGWKWDGVKWEKTQKGKDTLFETGLLPEEVTVAIEMQEEWQNALSSKNDGYSTKTGDYSSKGASSFKQIAKFIRKNDFTEEVPA